MEKGSKKKKDDKKIATPQKDYPKEVFNEAINDLVAPHIESMSWAYDIGIPRALESIPEMRLVTDSQDIRISWTSITIEKPSYDARVVYPAECRQSGTSYAGVTTVRAKVNIDGQEFIQSVDIGRIPIMVKSSKCHLYKASTQKLIRHHEEPQEGGGYFISNGGERLLRMLIGYRSNYLQAAERHSFSKVGHGFGDYGLVYRSLLADGTSRTHTFHHSNNGAITLRFYIDKNELLLPIVFFLKMVADTNDREIFNRVIECDPSKTYLYDGTEILLREANVSPQFMTKEQVIAHFGSSMRQPIEAIYGSLPYLSDLEVGRFVLDRYIFSNLKTDVEKFDVGILAIQKILFVVNGDSSLEGSDYADAHEIITPGQIVTAIIKERLERTLSTVKGLLKREAIKANITDAMIKKTMRIFGIGAKLSSFIATGNLASESGLDLSQTAGFTVVAEKINLMRFLGHFRSVHRGAFFATLRTTDVRKLRPESWGFFCPVHTPDGAPCGLLNHLTTTCKVVSKEYDTSKIALVMASLGMIPIRSFVPSKDHNKVIHITAMLDGSVIGKVPVEKARMIVDHLRTLKCENELPRDLEIVFTNPENGGKYPGITMFTSLNRMMRPVRNIKTGKTEYIGSAEQVYLNVAINDEEVRPGISTHVELNVTNLLSVVADLTPFSDYNQSPRNMYQCQMAKQTLGSAFHSYPYRNDNKIFRLQTPQAPLVQNRMQKVYGANDLPSGTNAVVAVISYTGYDMEDAMIINKSAYERGFKHASVYKTYEVDLEVEASRGARLGKKKSFWFSNTNPEDPLHVVTEDLKHLDIDGLPLVGDKMTKGKAFYSYWDDEQKSIKTTYWKGEEEAYIDEVLVLGRSKMTPNGINISSNATIKVRFNRNPVIGDKFASRAGQKGILSQLWPQVDMPFSESGMSPDIIINPHAFPSRMTIGMLIESMAGKSGSLHGMYQDSTPFQFDEKDKAIDYFGEQLIKAGYNYHGNEPMYSGIYGTEFRVDIYIGIVYYQRLRHMVKDKYQVRSSGPINPLTHQPVKGRKRGGGIRFGEMERDSILAHGTPHLLHDRLMLSSDAAKAALCTSCGSLLTPHFSSMTEIDCRSCESKKSIETVEIPYVFKYLATELAAANIKMTLSTS